VVNDLKSLKCIIEVIDIIRIFMAFDTAKRHRKQLWVLYVTYHA